MSGPTVASSVATGLLSLTEANVSALVDAILLRDNGGGGGSGGFGHAAGSIEQQRSPSSRDSMSGLLLLLRRRAVQADSLPVRLGVERHKQLLARLHLVLQLEDPATDVTLAVSLHSLSTASVRATGSSGRSLDIPHDAFFCVNVFVLHSFAQRTCAQLLLRIDSRWYTFVRDQDLPGVLADVHTPPAARERALRMVSDEIHTCSAAHGMHQRCQSCVCSASVAHVCSPLVRLLPLLTARHLGEHDRQQLRLQANGAAFASKLEAALAAVRRRRDTLYFRAGLDDRRTRCPRFCGRSWSRAAGGASRLLLAAIAAARAQALEPP
jgi:hypothetical protein